MSGVAEQLAALDAMATAALHAQWIAITDSPVPRVSPNLLRLALAWEIQASASTGMKNRAGPLLDQLARRSASAVLPEPKRLTREWRGCVYVVTIGEDQVIRWDERTWNSLSEVARAITGTRWSGPAFFGLRKKGAT